MYIEIVNNQETDFDFNLKLNNIKIFRSRKYLYGSGSYSDAYSIFFPVCKGDIVTCNIDSAIANAILFPYSY